MKFPRLPALMARCPPDGLSPRRSRARVPSLRGSSVDRAPAAGLGPFPGRTARTYSTISALKGIRALSRSPVAGRRWIARTTSIPSTTRPNAA